MADSNRRIIALAPGGKLVIKGGQHPALAGGPKGGGQTVYLVFDCSGSMAGAPLEQVKEGGVDFARTAVGKGYRVGVISFDSQARLRIEATESLPQIERAMNSLQSSGSTNMAHGLELAVGRLEHAGGARCIVLLTDGYPDSPAAALNQAGKAHELGIGIITIGTETADHAFLRKIATTQDLVVSTSTSSLSAKLASTALMLPTSKN